MPIVNMAGQDSRLFVDGGDGGGAGASISDGILTINGSGFGTKSTVAPLYYNDFDGETTGASATDVGMDSLGSDGTATVTVSTDRAHIGTKSMKCVYPAGIGGESFPRYGHSFPAGALQCYISFWLYYERTAGAGSTPIFKLARAGARSSYSGQPQFHDTIRPNSSLTVVARDTGYVTPADGTSYDPDGINGTPIAEPPNGGQWQFIEYLYRLSNPGGTNNGLFETWVNGVQNTGSSVVNSGGTPVTYGDTRDSGDTEQIEWIMPVFDGMSSYGSTNAYSVFADQLYVDTVFNRVLLTDAEDVTDSTVFVQQPLTGEDAAWGDEQIKTPAITTGLSGTAYAQVYGADNTLIDTYPVEIP